MLAVRTMAVCVLAAATGCAWAQTVRVQKVVSAKAVAGTVMNCKRSAAKCIIVVRVGPDPADAKKCIATIDIETVRIRKEIPVMFMLARDSMTDKDTYEFIDKGIVWDPPSSVPTTDQFVFVSLTGGNTVANWKTGKTKTTVDSGYLPYVKRTGGPDCGAGDPRIANDG